MKEFLKIFSADVKMLDANYSTVMFRQIDIFVKIAEEMGACFTY